MKPFTAICTALIDSGVIEVDRPSVDARDMMHEARRNHMRGHRREIRRNHARDQDRGWCCIGISIYPNVLSDMDEAVEDLKRAGHVHMTRSKLLRIGFQRLDLAALAAEEPE